MLNPAQRKCLWTDPQDVLLQDVMLAHLACTNRTAVMKALRQSSGQNQYHWGCSIMRLRSRYRILVMITMTVQSNLANTTLNSLQSIASATVTGTAHELRWQQSCRPSKSHYTLLAERIPKMMSAYQAYRFKMDHIAILPSPLTLPSNQK